MTDTLVVVEEAGQLLRPRGDGFYRAEGLPWSPAGVTYHVRALPTRSERFVAQTVVLRQSQSRIDLQPAAGPLPPVVLEAVLSDAEPVTTTGTRFRFIVADERNGLTWSALPTTGTISDVSATQQDDGSTYELAVEGSWSATTTGPAELIIRVSDSDGRSIEHSFRATWRSSD
ncbi:MAG: hypothetical protein D6761_12070 [Candidatus Dadabacteria bacterium]|nr:MAG: hypothetical protein D6761_12070 [Candidatus Dadabacteria bacterium]